MTINDFYGNRKYIFVFDIISTCMAIDLNWFIIKELIHLSGVFSFPVWTGQTTSGMPIYRKTKCVTVCVITLCCIHQGIHH